MTWPTSAETRRNLCQVMFSQNNLKFVAWAVHIHSSRSVGGPKHLVQHVSTEASPFIRHHTQLHSDILGHSPLSARTRLRSLPGNPSRARLSARVRNSDICPTSSVIFSSYDDTAFWCSALRKQNDGKSVWIFFSQAEHRVIQTEVAAEVYELTSFSSSAPRVAFHCRSSCRSARPGLQETDSSNSSPGPAPASPPRRIWGKKHRHHSKQ